ncbi:hypothetical protein Dimus_026191 [Dionaea muscipula]
MAIQAQMYPENMGLPLCGSQDWLMIDNACTFNDFAFNLESSQKMQQQQQQLQRKQQLMLQLQNQQQQKNQFLAFESSLLFPSSSKNFPTTTTTSCSPTIHHNNAAAAGIADDNSGNLTSIPFSQSMAAQFVKQRQEMDAYITLQNERLKLALQEQSKRQLSSLLRNLEASTSMMLKQKDEEITRSNKRATELNEFVRKLEVENQLWRRVAAENEAMICSLNSTIEQLREKAASSLPSNVADDAESCCCVEEEAGENRGDAEGEERFGGMSMMMMMCRRCNSRNSCVLFLPCRHLCSCKDCEAFLDACPVCKSVKQASIEALFS